MRGRAWRCLLVDTSWRWQYVASTLSEVFRIRWRYRLLLRSVHGWWRAVEQSLASGWLLGLSLSRWRNPLAHMAFSLWLRNVCQEQPAGLCAGFQKLGADERRARALEEPAGWNFDSRTAEQAEEEEEEEERSLRRLQREPESHGRTTRVGSTTRVYAGERHVVDEPFREGESSLRQVAEAESPRRDEATKDDDGVNDRDSVAAVGTRRDSYTMQPAAAAPGPEPEPEREDWLTSVFGTVPACCVAD